MRSFRDCRLIAALKKSVDFWKNRSDKDYNEAKKWKLAYLKEVEAKKMDEYWDFQCCKYGEAPCPCGKTMMCVEHCDATLKCLGVPIWDFGYEDLKEIDEDFFYEGYYDDEGEYPECIKEEMQEAYTQMARYYDTV